MIYNYKLYAGTQKIIKIVLLWAGLLCRQSLLVSACFTTQCTQECDEIVSCTKWIIAKVLSFVRCFCNVEIK